jgi:hypothetical protein
MTQFGARRYRHLPMRPEPALDPNHRAPAQIDLPRQHRSSSTAPHLCNRLTNNRRRRVVRVRKLAGLGQRSAVDRRTVSVSWLVKACRAQSARERPILPPVSVILLRRDWRSASRSTRGCDGYASTMWLTPHTFAWLPPELRVPGWECRW